MWKEAVLCVGTGDEVMELILVILYIIFVAIAMKIIGSIKLPPPKDVD